VRGVRIERDAIAGQISENSEPPIVGVSVFGVSVVAPCASAFANVASMSSVKMEINTAPTFAPAGPRCGPNR
jgi:hypothetical protein